MSVTRRTGVVSAWNFGGAVTLLAALGAASAACGGRGTPVYPGADIVLVTLDTTRADRLGAYGHAGASTPHLDGLAGDGIRFSTALAPVPLTLPSHTSLMTATIPPRHGVRDNGGFEMADGLAYLAESLASGGYDTGAFVGAYVLHSRWGLDRGFVEYDDRFDYGSADSVAGQVERRGDRVIEAALPWLRERATTERPYFAWVHLYDPHAPYSAPEPWASRIADPYDAELAYTDSLVGQLLEQVRASGRPTIVVLTADHGEGLGDHDEPGHGLFIYDTTQMVPLILKLPDDRAAGTVIESQVRLIDVAPTLLELTGLDVPAAFDGRSLLSLLAGDDEDRPAYMETMFPRFHFGWSELYGLRDEGHKYILAPRPELYDVVEDPGERRNIGQREAAVAARLRTRVEELRGSEPVAGPELIDSEAAERLRALGYIGTAPAETEGPLPDPKDKLPLFTDLTRAQGQLHAGDAEAALELLESIVAEDPNVVDAQFTRGNALMRLGRDAEAAEAFKATLQLSPEYDLALSNLGLAHRRLGLTDQARGDFEALLAMQPGSTSAAYNLGEMELEAGRPREALRFFEAGLAANESQPGLQFGAGVASLQLGDFERARTALERAAELAPNHAEVHYYRAQLAAQRNDGAAEERLYRTQLETNPAHARTLFNLAQIVSGRDEHAEAVTLLERAVTADPDMAVGHLYLARELLTLDDPGRLREAEAAAQRGLQLNPPAELTPLGHLVLADIYNRLGDAAAVERHLRLARAAQSGSPRED